MDGFLERSRRSISWILMSIVDELSSSR
jgi:hypothetical protein